MKYVFLQIMGDICRVDLNKFDFEEFNYEEKALTHLINNYDKSYGIVDDIDVLSLGAIDQFNDSEFISAIIKSNAL